MRGWHVTSSLAGRRFLCHDRIRSVRRGVLATHAHMLRGLLLLLRTVSALPPGEQLPQRGILLLQRRHVWRGVDEAWWMSWGLAWLLLVHVSLATEVAKVCVKSIVGPIELVRGGTMIRHVIDDLLYV